MVCNRKKFSHACIECYARGRRGGGGGYFSGQNMEIPRERGAYMKFPPWWEYGYFLELHNTGNHQPGDVVSVSDQQESQCYFAH